MSALSGDLYNETMCLQRETYYEEIVVPMLGSEEEDGENVPDDDQKNKGNGTNVDPDADGSDDANKTDDGNQTQKNKTESIKRYTYDYCIEDQTFVAVDLVTPPRSFPENGVLGLAPNKNKMSIVRTLKEQNKINRELVTLNLEDQRHYIIFGTVDFPSIATSNDELSDQVF